MLHLNFGVLQSHTSAHGIRTSTVGIQNWHHELHRHAFIFIKLSLNVCFQANKLDAK